MQEKKPLSSMRGTLNQQSEYKVIPFPSANQYDLLTKNQRKPASGFQEIAPKNNTHGNLRIIQARPGEELSEYVPDFRHLLQRNGLILLSWDKRSCEIGELYTAYWVTSSGIHRYYASPALHIEEFREAMPNRKSYAAEDGIDFYGQAGPDYIVYVAPELMMSSSEKLIQRPEHIKKLKTLGIGVDFDYPFLLTTEREKSRSLRSLENRNKNENGHKRHA